MSRLGSVDPQSFMGVLTGMVSQAGFGVYPSGFRSNGIVFGMDDSVLAPRKPLVAIDGSPQSVFKAEEPGTFRGRMEGMSLVSRDATGRGLFPEIRSLEKTLNVSARQIFKLAGEGESSLEECRPGIAQRIKRYGGVSIRDVVRGAGGDERLPHYERASDLAKDIAFVSGIVKDEETAAPELLFVVGVLYAALNAKMRLQAARSFKRSAELLFAGERPNAAAAVGELAMYSTLSSKWSTPREEIGVRELVARAWLASAMEFAGDESAAMIVRSRGLSAALAADAFESAARLYNLDAESARGKAEQGKGFMRAAWVLAGGIDDRNADYANWKQVGSYLTLAAETWKDEPELAEERGYALKLAEFAERM